MALAFLFCDQITEILPEIGYTKATKKNNKEDLQMSAMNIDRNNFRQEVLDSEKPVLLDFWAPWCGPCRMVVPIVEEIAAERSDVKVGKVNIDEQFELAREFGISTIPTLVVMKEGKVIRQSSGARPKAQILAMLEN